MKILNSILVILILSFQPLGSTAQTCKAFYHSLNSISTWTDLMEQIGKNQGSISLDLFTNGAVDSKSFGKLMKQLGKLTADPEALNPKNIDRLTDQMVEQLYEFANASGDDKVSFSESGLSGTRMKALHKGLFYEILKPDLKSALQDYLHNTKPPNRFLKPFVVTKDRLRAYVKKNGTKIRIGFWASIHVPLAVFGQYLPWYLFKKGNLKFKPETVELVRRALNDGNFNLALKMVKSDLDAIYTNPHARHQIYSLIHQAYNTFSSLVLAHIIMSSAVV